MNASLQRLIRRFVGTTRTPQLSEQPRIGRGEQKWPEAQDDPAPPRETRKSRPMLSTTVARPT